jgi:hypothetical protein
VDTKQVLVAMTGAEYAALSEAGKPLPPATWGELPYLSLPVAESDLRRWSDAEIEEKCDDGYFFVRDADVRERLAVAGINVERALVADPDHPGIEQSPAVRAGRGGGADPLAGLLAALGADTPDDDFFADD